MEKNSSKEYHANKEPISQFNFDPLWFIISVLKKKYLFLILSLTVTVLIVCISAYIYITSPVIKFSKLNFSLTFNGAMSGTYPNGSKFSEEDIISTPVLQKVYETSDMKKFYKTFSAFKNAVSVQRYNPRLEFLKSEFKAKLEDKEISSARRYELEREFFRQEAIITAKPHFELIMTAPDVQKFNMPNAIAGKVLYRILKDWLYHAKTRQGVTKYDISLITNTISDDTIKNADYFNGTDNLRIMLDDLFEEVKQLETIPNITHVVFNKDGKTFTLKDIKLKLNFIKNYLLNPLLEQIESSVAYKDKTNVLNYIEDALDSLSLKYDSIQKEKSEYENMLINHVMSSPEILQDVNRQERKLKQDVNFYDGYLKLFKNNKNKATDEDLAKIVKAQHKLLIAENHLIQFIYDFYTEASRYNLEGDNSFYSVNSFSTYEQKLLKSSFVLKVAAIAWALSEFLILLSIVASVFLKELFKQVDK